MPHTKPTLYPAGKLTQEPAPPITRDDILDSLQRNTRLQRQNWTSNNYNSYKSVARIFVDWVMEDEVPAGNQRFLRYPTRRAFIEDRVQIRVQVHKMALNNPKIVVYLYDADRPTSEYALIVGSDNAEMNTLHNRGLPAEHRAIKVRNNISDLSTVRGETGIYLEVDAAQTRSFIATTLILPAAADEELPAVNYYARVEIIDGGQTYQAYSPTIVAVRWWARPSQNLDVVRTRATAVTPLIDGENYFHQVAQLLSAAQAGDHIYLASWSFNPFTMMEGGVHAVENGAAAGDWRTAMQDSLASKIHDAVAANATVHILLDSFNAPFGEEYVVDLKNFNYFAGNEDKVEIRSSGHPKHIKVGVGKLAKKERIGSYHEKYVCLIGSQHVALIGGIDAEADRMNPQGHGWRHWARYYRDLLKTHIYDRGPGDDAFVDRRWRGDHLMPWHDVGVKVEGQRAIHDLCEDFVRRWNAGDGGGNALVHSAAPGHLAGERNLQFVKTDRLKAPHLGVREGTHCGTLDATLQAVREARHYIYMENQYMRDQELAAAIAGAMRDNTGLQVILIIPFETEEAARAGQREYQHRTLLWMLKEPGTKIGKIQERAAIHGDYLQYRFITQLRAVDPARVGVYALATYVGDRTANLPEQIYPHAKTMVVDDTWAYIGSANANGRSLKLDGESGYIIHDRAVVTAYRRSLWQEHLGLAPPDTREIRDFLAHWDGHCVKGQSHLLKLTMPELATTSAVELQNPPQGQEYNGPGSWLVDIHDFV